MLTKNKRVLKNGAVAGYVYYKKEKKWKWRIIKGPTKGGANNTSTNSTSIISSSNGKPVEIKKCKCELKHKNITIININGSNKKFEVKAIDQIGNEQEMNISKLGGGLGGDIIYRGTQEKDEHDCCKTDYIFKIFKNKTDQETEIKTINILNSMNGGILNIYTPNMFFYGTIHDKTKKIMKLRIGHYLRSEAITNISLHNAIKYKCEGKTYDDISNNTEKDFYKKLNTPENWRLVILQLFHILSVMTINFFSHCDFHGDNIILTDMPSKKKLTIDLKYLGINDPPFEITESCLLMKLIDFDTGKYFKFEPNIQYCSDWKSVRSGTTTLLPKTNQLRKICGLKYKKNTIKNLPMGNWLKTRTDPVHGDWYNFGHFLVCLKQYNIFPNLDRKRLWRIIKRFNQNRVNAYFKSSKCNRNKKKLIEQFKFNLRQIYIMIR